MVYIITINKSMINIAIIINIAIVVILGVAVVILVVLKKIKI